MRIPASRFGHVVAVCVMGFALSGWAETTLDVEAGLAMPGYNDVAIPGDTGTKFSLTDDLDAGDAWAFRARLGRTFSGKHWVGLLAAPLSVQSSGTLDKAVHFNGADFPAGTGVDATFRFDSYRLIYRYLLHETDAWQFSCGAALKVRDAAIKLESAGVESEKTNTGAVPLLSFRLAWTPAAGWHLVMDGEALAAPQGRAEDVLFSAQYDVGEQVSLSAGYRILEGGADNDEVYTFSLFHYAVIGATLSW